MVGGRFDTRGLADELVERGRHLGIIFHMPPEEVAEPDEATHLTQIGGWPHV